MPKAPAARSIRLPQGLMVGLVERGDPRHRLRDRDAALCRFPALPPRRAGSCRARRRRAASGVLAKVGRRPSNISGSSSKGSRLRSRKARGKFARISGAPMPTQGANNSSTKASSERRNVKASRREPHEKSFGIDAAGMRRIENQRRGEDRGFENFERRRRNRQPPQARTLGAFVSRSFRPAFPLVSFPDAIPRFAWRRKCARGEANPNYASNCKAARELSTVRRRKSEQDSAVAGRRRCASQA